MYNSIIWSTFESHWVTIIEHYHFEHDTNYMQNNTKEEKDKLNNDQTYVLCKEKKKKRRASVLRLVRMNIMLSEH